MQSELESLRTTAKEAEAEEILNRHAKRTHPGRDAREPEGAAADQPGRHGAHGETRDWKTLRRLLSTHSLVTTALPLKDGRVLRIRKPCQPDAEEARIYQKPRIDWKAAFRPVKSFAKP